MSTIHCNTPSTKFSRLISRAKSNDEMACIVFKFIKNCRKLKPHCPLPQEVWIFKSIKNKTCYDCVLFYISIPVYWANTRNSSCLTPNIWQTFYKWYSSQKSKYIIKLPYIFISSKYLNLQGKAREHSKVIIKNFMVHFCTAYPYVLTLISLNYKAIIMQFSDPFLIIISTTTGSKYVKFVRYHLKVSSCYHIYNS
jgi:hypothetical protein